MAGLTSSSIDPPAAVADPGICLALDRYSTLCYIREDAVYKNVFYAAYLGGLNGSRPVLSTR